MSINRDMFKALQPGVDALINQKNENMRAGQQNELAKYLQGNRQEFETKQANEAPRLAGEKQAAENKVNLQTLSSPEMTDIVHNGGSASAGTIHAGADPYAHMAMKNQQGDAMARQQANKAYMAGLPKLQQQAQAASEGLDFSNDPSNPGSLGQARTLMLKAMGMNRYNEQEAKAVLPPALQGHVAMLFNAVGGDMSPLNEAQRTAVNTFFKGSLDHASTQHQMLKQNAMQAYTSSPYANEVGMKALSTLGSPMEQSLQQASQKYQAIPQTKGPNLTAQPQPGMLDKLKSYFGGSQSQPQASAPQSGPHGPAVTQGGVTYKWNPQSGNYE